MGMDGIFFRVSQSDGFRFIFIKDANASDANWQIFKFVSVLI
jgi:hypothetical protein